MKTFRSNRKEVKHKLNNDFIQKRAWSWEIEKGEIWPERRTW